MTMNSIPSVAESVLVKKTSDTRIYFEFKHFFDDPSIGATQAGIAVAQMHDIISAEPLTEFTILVKLAPESEITTTLDSNRAYMDIIMDKQVKKIAIIFEKEKHSKSVNFVVDVFQKLTDKIHTFANQADAEAWLDE